MKKMNLKKFILITFLIPCVFIFYNSCKQEQNSQQNEWQDRKDQLISTYDQEFMVYLDNAQQTMGKTIMIYKSITNQHTIPKHIKIEGSYYDYGRLVALISQQYGRSPSRITSGMEEFNNRIIEMYQRVYPQFLEIARGVGDIFDIPIAELNFIHFEDEFFQGLWWNLFKYQEFYDLRNIPKSTTAPANHDCALVSANIGDNTIVGRNFDNDHIKPHFVVHTNMQGAYKVLANTSYNIYHWIMDGINEKGLVMGTAANVDPPEYFWTDAYPDVPAIQQNHLFRIALETCASVEEVIKLYRSVRPWSPHTTGHLLVADAKGNSAVIEFDLDREPDFFRSTKGYQVLTNIAYHKGIDYMMENCWRFKRATDVAEAGIDSTEDVLDIMLAIRGTFGYTSLFDIKKGKMFDYFPSDLNTGYEFKLE
jgi:predicted choloylglycine hydrolase